MKTLLLSLLLLGGSIAKAQDFDYSFRESYKITAPAKLTLSSSDGDIEVLPGKSDEIEVFFLVRKDNRLLEISRAQLEEELTLTIIKTGNSLDINVKYPSTNWNMDWRDRLQVSFMIYAPKETTSDLRSSDGNVKLSGLSGSQKLKTSDGDISLKEITGDVSGVTSDGDIEGEKIKGKVYVRTSDGNIDLNNVIGSVESISSDGDIRLSNIQGQSMAQTSDGDLELNGLRGGNHSARSSDGDIYFRDLSGGMDATTSDGSIRGNIVELKNSFRARTSDGNIEILVPANLGMNLYMKGESIDVPLVNFSGKSTKELLDGKMNGGGEEVNLTTSDGRITLYYK